MRHGKKVLKGSIVLLVMIAVGVALTLWLTGDMPDASVRPRMNNLGERL